MDDFAALRTDLTFLPSQVEAMARAFDQALTALGTEGRSAASREIVSSFIIAAAMAGEADPARLCEAGVTGFRCRGATG